MNESNPFLTFESESNIQYPIEHTMESVITSSHSVPGLHPIFAFGKSKLGRVSFSLKDGNNLQFPKSNVRASFAQRNPDSGRSINGEDNTTPQSYNKDEILALFRRIQTSISGESNNASAESVLEVLRKSRNQVKGKTSNRGEWKKGEEKEEIVDFKSIDAKISRPPSNFMKRSPIPYVEKVQDEVKSVGFETMKLAELKELAKSRGIKGYSKLKKGELIELLKTM